ISGVGEGKVQKYGKQFVALISKYVEDNEIERPQDLFTLKSTAGKSDLKVYLIQSIDRKLTLDSMSKAKDMSVRELLHELESVVNTGTKLNLDYLLKDMMDDEEENEIFDFYRSTENASLESAIDEYGDVYSEEELHLLRIKFIS